ncbi:MAG: hypothetical protein AB4368_13740 [Xenococcaceae cyanobacterium]
MNTSEIREILALPQQHRATTTRLLDLYLYIKDIWSSSAFYELRDKHDLNLRTTQGKLALARLAGEIELRYCDTSPGAGEDKRSNENLASTLAQNIDTTNTTLTKQTQTTQNTQTNKILVKVIGLLLPGKELNGRQLTPAFRVFGMATTKDMLRHNYKLLRKIEHPDVSKYEPEIASARYAFITKLYRVIYSNWDEKYNPTLPLSPSVLSKAMDVKLPFSASSFYIEN